MRRIVHWQRIPILGRAEPWLLASVFVLSLAILCFAFIVDVIAKSPVEFDQYLLLFFRSSTDPSVPFGPAWLREMARDVTALGSLTILAFLILVVTTYLMLANKPLAAVLLVTAMGGGAVINSLLKLFFARPRPAIVVPSVRVFSDSFPSGHAALSTMVYLTLAVMLGRTIGSRTLSVFFLIVAMLVAAIVGISRVYLGVHYPTDILAGWCVGSAYAIACWTTMLTLQRVGRGDSRIDPG